MSKLWVICDESGAVILICENAEIANKYLAQYNENKSGFKFNVQVINYASVKSEASK